MAMDKSETFISKQKLKIKIFILNERRLQMQRLVKNKRISVEKIEGALRKTKRGKAAGVLYIV